ncbi:MCE family protein [Pseudonocardia alni]|jgi:phospholipid/cholesterol/gamma-HCH transport system substrate-binding protein|uniref:MCE family protein n=1 Tax=Pseudonocardia alni TaxID=33907 RepID=UPI0036C23984
MSRLRSALVALPLAVLLAGCGSGGVYDFPLPGGADVGDRPYTVTVQFQDVLDLVPRSMVKVDGVEVGRVESVALAADGWTADVLVTLPGDVAVPQDATFSLQQTSLLGEKYVSISVPEGATGRIAPGTVVPLAATDRGVEVEEVLGALSMVLNGGAVEQVRTIAQEVNAALEGNETEVRALLGDLDTFVGGLDEQRAEIVRALDSLNALGGQLQARTGQIAAVLEGIGPGLAVLESQRTELVGMLASLDRLSDVGVDVINRSQDDVVEDLRLLTPTLEQLAVSAEDLAVSLSVVPTYPFHDEYIRAEQGDYVDGFLRVTGDLTDILGNLGRTQQPILDPEILGGPQAGGVEQPPPASPGEIPPVPIPALPGGGGQGGLGDLLGSVVGGG